MRYILDNLGYIEAVSCTHIECNNKSCQEYTGTIPDGYSSFAEWAEKVNIRAYKIVDGNLTLDTARAAELEAEWAICKDPKIVYDMTLTTAVNSIDVTGLDMVRDGGEYEFEFIHSEATTGDIYITFNDLDAGYYQEGLYHSNNLTANGTLTTVSFYRPNMTGIYYGTGGSTSNQFPGVMKGRFKFSNTTRKAIYYELRNVVCINGSQAISELYGVNGTAVDNLTSLKFVKYNGINFLAGTRLIVRKK